ncbi:hypothetical protein D3C87_262290 [compost metagenome]
MEIDEHKLTGLNEHSYLFQNILEKVPSRIIRWGNTLFLIVMLLFLIALWTIRYPDVVTSDTKIQSENPVIEVRGLTSGRIIHILKNNRARVTKDEWIVILQNNANYHDVARLNQQLLFVDHADFWKEIDRLKPDQHYDLGELNGIYLSLIRSVEEYQLFTSLNSSSQQISVNKRREQDFNNIRIRLENQRDLLKEELAIEQKDLERVRKLSKQEAIPKWEAEQKEITYLKIKNRLEELENTILNTSLNKELVRKENFSLSAEQAERFFELRSNVITNYDRLRSQLEEWKRKYVLAAPISGVLDFYEIRSKEQFLEQGQKLFTVSPIGKHHYYAYLKLPVANSGKVHTGQEVLIRLFNYPYQEFGMIRGKVATVSSAPREGFYHVKVRLTNQLVTTNGSNLKDKLELIGTADIITKDRSLFDRLFNFISH